MGDEFEMGKVDPKSFKNVPFAGADDEESNTPEADKAKRFSQLQSMPINKGFMSNDKGQLENFDKYAKLIRLEERVFQEDGVDEYSSDDEREEIEDNSAFYDYESKIGVK